MGDLSIFWVFLVPIMHRVFQEIYPQGISGFIPE